MIISAMTPASQFNIHGGGMSKYSTKPVVIEAVQLTRELLARCLFDGEAYPARVRLTYASTYPPERLINYWKGSVTTLIGEIPCAIDDWIITNAKDVYPCKPDVFAATYDPVRDKPLDTTTPDGEALRNVAPDA